MVDTGRRSHYGAFYDASHQGRLALVWGNCQAESLRVLLSGSPTFPTPTIRVPPVHELEQGDLAPLTALLPHVSVLITQPVRPGYRDLPVGSDEIAERLAPGSRVIRWPVIRYVGLHPFSAIVRHPSDPSLDPPVVPYHDLRTLARAAGKPAGGPPGPVTLRAIAASSVAELARRERGGTDVAVSDLLLPLGDKAAHTLNHPGNDLLIALARRVQEALGVPPDADDPGRELLGGISAPLEPEVLDALGLSVAPRSAWTIHGTSVSCDEVEEAQLRWYGENPGCVEEGMRRYADRLALLDS